MSNRFEELIAQGEGISVEFKECKDSLPKSIFETFEYSLRRVKKSSVEVKKHCAEVKFHKILAYFTFDTSATTFI